MHIQLMDFGGALSRGEKLSLNFKQEKKTKKKKKKIGINILEMFFFKSRG